MQFLIKDKKFYQSLAVIAIPIALQNTIAFGVQMMDTIMVGALGDTMLSAASLANQPFFIFMMLNFGLGAGGSVLIAQYWGKGNVNAVRRVMSISMRFVAIAAVFFSFICYLFPLEIMGLLSAEQAVMIAGASYLKTVSFSYLFYGLTNCYIMSLRAVENVKLSTRVYIVSFFVNVFFNYVFIYGKFGFPKLGIVGAAVGTVIARFAELLIVFVYMTFFEKKIRFHFGHLFRRDKELVPDFIRHSMPVVGNELVWGLSFVTQAAIIGHLGTVFVAANSIASVVQQLAMVLLFGIGNAAAVRIGNAVGAGRTQEVRNMSKTLLVLAFGFGLIACGIILGLRYPAVLFYDVSQQVKDLAVDIMGVMAVAMVFSGIEIVSIIGILRGAGDTKVGFAFDAGCAWLVAVPMGLLAAFVWELPAVWVCIFLRSDVPVRTVLCLFRVLRGRFIKNVTRDV